jgi:hypothetical protein
MNEQKLREAKEIEKYHVLNIINHEIQSLKDQIKQCNDTLKRTDLKKWIKKEFEVVLKGATKDLKDATTNYKRVQNIKEGKLTKEQKLREMIRDILKEGKLTEANKSLPPFEIAKRMMKSKYWNKAGKGFSEKVIKKFRGRGVTPKSLDKWLPDYIDGKEISKLFEGKLSEVSAGVNVWYFYKKANKDKNKFFKMLSDFRKKHSDTKWIKMLNYALDDFNENPKKYKTIDDKQNILFKNLQNNKKVREGKLTEGGAQIAKTILKQLGGNKFIAMTGAKNLAHTNKGLQMKIGRNAKGVTHVIIDLDKGKDLYDIEFVKVRGTSRKTVKKLKGIYADQLGEIFTRYTGLNVRL